MFWNIGYPTSRTSATLIFNSRGRVVGRLVVGADGRLWLCKTGLDPERHKLRCPPGWATDLVHLQELRRQDGVGVRLVLKDGRVLEASLEDFRRYGVWIDRGHGPQVVLPEAYWRRSGAEQLRLFGEEVRR